MVVGGGDEIEVGYALMPQYWGRGLATELARECARIGFEQLGQRDLVAFTLPTNYASRSVMQRVGFLYERDVIWAGMPHVLYRLPVEVWRGEDWVAAGRGTVAVASDFRLAFGCLRATVSEQRQKSSGQEGKTGQCRRLLSASARIQPLQDPAVLLARIGVREILDLAEDDVGAGALQLAVGDAGGGDGEHPVERAVHEVDAAAGGALEVAVHEVGRDGGRPRHGASAVNGMSGCRPQSRV